MNSPLQKEKVCNLNSESQELQNTSPVKSGIILGEDALTLKSFIQYAIDNNLKGFELALEAKKNNTPLSYNSLIQKIKNYKIHGAQVLVRKEKKDKGEVKSFSNEVLKKLQDIFVDKIIGGCGIRAYEDTHKWLRSISRNFISLKTGEEFIITNGFLCNVQDNKIISSHSTIFESGIYKIDIDKLAQFDSTFELRIGSLRSAQKFLLSVKKHNGDAMFLNRFGIHDFRNKRQHTMKLDYSNLKPNDLIVGDGKKLDIVVISEDWRRVYRPWLMGWENMSTRQYCYELAESETSESIANSLAVAINDWGIPKEIKHDNGKSYKSGRFDMMKKSFGIKTHFAIVKLARAKPIESFHNVLDNLLKTKIGYTGNKYQEFPNDTRERLKFVLGEQKDLKRVEKQFKENKSDEIYFENICNPEARMKSSKKRLMHISELIEVLQEAMNIYHERIHGGLKKDKLGRKVYDLNCKDEMINEYGEKLNSPLGRADYHLRKGFVPVMADPSAVSIFAMNIELRTVQLKRGVSLSNEEYFHPVMQKYAGEKVLIRYTHTGAETIYMFHSEELQKIGDKKYLTTEMINDAKFICLGEKMAALEYNDEAYKINLNAQRSEEKKLRDSIKISKPNPFRIHTLTGIESQIGAIQDAEEQRNFEQLIKHTTKKLKRLNDD